MRNPKKEPQVVFHIKFIYKNIACEDEKSLQPLYFILKLYIKIFDYLVYLS